MTKLANYCIWYLDQNKKVVPLEQIFARNHEGILLSQLLNLFKEAGLEHRMSDKEQAFFRYPLSSLINEYQNIIEGELPMLADIDNGLLVLLGLIINYGSEY